MNDQKSSAHFTVSALDQLSHSLRISKDFNATGSLKSMDPRRAGAFATFAGSPGQRNAVQITAGSFRVSTLSAHPNIVFAYDNPSVRFGDRTRASSRAVSKEGATSFHFAHSYMSKTSPIQNLIREFNGGRAHFNSKANDHLLYIERDGAAEVLGQRKRYDGLDGILDNFEGLKDAVADRNAQEQQDYLERAGAAEKMHLRNLSDDEIDALENASFGTIGRTLEERHHFWNEVEKLEADPRGDKVKLDINHDQRIWDLVRRNRKSAPEPLSTHLEAKQNDPAPETIVLHKVATPIAFAIYKWAYGLDQDFPIVIQPGRGGRIQNRIIAELAHELDPQERIRIVRDFTSKLTENGLPFWAVVHAPDENNDRRNYHAHIVYYDRPAARMADPKDPTKLVWDFEIQDITKYQSRNTRIARPHAQNKFRGANDQKWIKELREHWETVSNAGMRDAGLDKRYDARTYKEMGIDLEPLKHIPSKTFNKERKGDLTPEGVLLARRQWDLLLEKAIADNYLQTSLRRRNIARNAERVERLLVRTNPNKPLATRQLQRIAKIADKYAVLIGLSELCQDATRIVVDRVASRARLVFHAAFGDTDKKQRGRPRKTPLALPQLSKTLTADAEEARKFLKTILPKGIWLDERNGRELQEARHGLALMSRRLEDFEKNPSLNQNDRRQPSYVDLDRLDPPPEEILRRREDSLKRLEESVTALAAGNLAELLNNARNETVPPERSSGSSEMKPDEPIPPPSPGPAEPSQRQPAPPTLPEVPATGPGSRPAYLDEKNPKGTRYRYEPFSIRPDRPPKGSKLAPSASAGTEIELAPKPRSEQTIMPAKLPHKLAQSQGSNMSLNPRRPDQEASNALKASSKIVRLPEATETPPPSAASKHASAARTRRSAFQPEATRPAEQKSLPASVAPATTTVPNAMEHYASTPARKGSFTIGAKPTTLPPSRISGIVVQGTPFKPPQSAHELAPTPSSHLAQDKAAAPVSPISETNKPQPGVGKVAVLTKRRLKHDGRKGRNRSGGGPER